MLTGEVSVGQLVKSKAGRDKGKYYLISEVLDEAFVRIIDGEKRNLSNPKRKNLKHLELLPIKAEVLSEKISRGAENVSAEVSQAVRQLGFSQKD